MHEIHAGFKIIWWRVQQKVRSKNTIIKNKSSFGNIYYIVI